MEQLKKLTSKQIWLFSIVISIAMSELIVVCMEMLLKGTVTSDYLLTGLVASLLVSGLIIGILTFFLAQQKNNEKFLESMQLRYEYLLKAAPAVIYSCRASGDFGATFISGNITEQFGYQPKQFIEDPSFWINHIHPDDRLSVIKGHANVLNAASHQYEYRFQHKDGSFRWVHDNLSVIRDSAGQPIEMVGSWIDISQRKKAEDALTITYEELVKKNARLESFHEVSVNREATIEEMKEELNGLLERLGEPLKYL